MCPLSAAYVRLSFFIAFIHPCNSCLKHVASRTIATHVSTSTFFEMFVFLELFGRE